MSYGGSSESELWLIFGIPYALKPIKTFQQTLGYLTSVCYQGNHDKLTCASHVLSTFKVRSSSNTLSALLGSEIRRCPPLANLKTGNSVHMFWKAAPVLSWAFTKFFIRQSLIWRCALFMSTREFSLRNFTPNYPTTRSQIHQLVVPWHSPIAYP